MDLPMQQAIIANAEPTPSVSTPPTFVPSPQKPFPWLTVIFALLFATSLVAGAFFFYQTQELRKQLFVSPSPTPSAPTPSAQLTSTNESEEAAASAFINDFASTYSAGNWDKLQTMLAQQQAKEMMANKTNLPVGGYNFDKFELTKLTKTNTGYTATIVFYQNGQPYQRAQGDIQIMITKENGSWKSLSWYLFE